MNISSNYASLLADLGNEPGLQQGDVLVRLGDGRSERVPSADVTFLVEAGNLLGIHARLRDDRKVFWPASSVLAIEDAPA